MSVTLGGGGRRTFFRWLRRAGLVLLLGIVSVAIHYFYNHWQIDKRLTEAIDAQDRAEPGWRWADLEAARTPVADADNAAEFVLAAAGRLPPEWKESSHAALLKQVPANERLPAALAGPVANEVRQYDAAIATARKLVDPETGRYPFDYHPFSLSILLPYVPKVRGVAGLLCLDVAGRLEQDDLKGALVSCRAAINAARSFGDDPFTVSLIVRIASLREARSSLERILGQGVLAEKELEAVQRLLEREDNEQGFERATRCERALLHGLLEFMESGAASLSELAGEGKQGLWDSLTSFYARDRFRDEHPKIFQYFDRQLAVARLPMPERGAAQQDCDAHLTSMGRTPVTLLMPALGKVERIDRMHHASMRCAVAGLAAERYRLKHGDWPTSAVQLRDLSGIALTDPIDGQPLRIRRVDDGLVIYSIKLDGKDNGKGAGTTEGEFRLWDVTHRRRPPGPGQPLEPGLGGFGRIP